MIDGLPCAYGSLQPLWKFAYSVPAMALSVFVFRWSMHCMASCARLKTTYGFKLSQRNAMACHGCANPKDCIALVALRGFIPRSRKWVADRVLLGGGRVCLRHTEYVIGEIKKFRTSEAGRFGPSCRRRA